MTLPIEQRKQYRAIAHHLKPIVTIAGAGITEGVINELERALNDHELIKVKIAVGEKEERAEVIKELCEMSRSELVQVIGRTAILLRKNPRPNPKLSNLLRHQSGAGK
ncbi:ribosome assembly RNA-binding protein YhbY [Hahella aquimaris]|uniref:ribosome assembly RNA-binding protein YhbY n=1 Tax=Hahella sp. HNIBRBA332 TaxID=3015983 RepID=UPI00273CE908|nr:ribosome assembly RNA-binding protein YhbY [Hahella sp. HNIBRBA332]WLQ12061.1 ribosome assembly RNA-binding protein YhbY [Hahella sp. HNIBRBA332]